MNIERDVPAQRDFPPGRLLARMEHLRSEARGSLDARHAAPKRPRRRAIMLLPAALLLLGAGFLVTYSPEQVLHGVGCFDDVGVDSNTTVVDADGRQPEDICRELWAEGVVAAHESPFYGTQPPLTACVPSFGSVVWVFPSRDPDVCEDQGGSPLPAGYEKAATRFAALKQEMDAEFADRCVKENAARDLARQILNRHGATDWRIAVRVEPWTPEQPCTAVDLDADERVAYLGPEEGTEEQT